MAKCVGAILCFDLTNSCWNCDDRLPREPVEGRYCSTACFDDARERLEAEQLRRACCAECGYDRQEHSPTCSRATAQDRAREAAGR